MITFVNCAVNIIVMTSMILFVSTVTVSAWSGINAYSIVLLTNIDTSEHIWNAFYEGAVNTTLELYAEDVRVMQGEASRSLSNDDDFLNNLEYRNIVDKLWIPRDHYPYLVRLSDEWVVLDVPVHKYKNMFVSVKNDIEQNIINAQLNNNESNHNNSLNYNQNNHLAIDSSNVVLLHCRLPLPQTREEVRLRRSQFIKTESPRFQMLLMNWWRNEAAKRASHCLYGDGEGVFTLTPRFYDLCPLEHIWRVRHVALYKALWLEEQMSSGQYAHMHRTSVNQSNKQNDNISKDYLTNSDTNFDVNHENKISRKRVKEDNWANISSIYLHHNESEKHSDKNARSKKKKLSSSFHLPDIDPHNETVTRKIISFMRQMHKSSDKWHEIIRNSKYAHAFQQIGTFHAEISRPRWNTELHVWEMLYPSLEPCETHYTSLIPPELTTSASPWWPTSLSTLYEFFANKVNDVSAKNYQKEDETHGNVFTKAETGKERQETTSKTKPLSTWRTVVKFRCPSTAPYNVGSSSTGSGSGGGSSSSKNSNSASFPYGNWVDEMQNMWSIKHWTVTEVRQMCRYEFEIATNIVCEWEQELDRLNVNAIPCDELR